MMGDTVLHHLSLEDLPLRSSWQRPIDEEVRCFEEGRVDGELLYWITAASKLFSQIAKLLEHEGRPVAKYYDCFSII